LTMVMQSKQLTREEVATVREVYRII